MHHALHSAVSHPKYFCLLFEKFKSYFSINGSIKFKYIFKFLYFGFYFISINILRHNQSIYFPCVFGCLFGFGADHTASTEDSGQCFLFLIILKENFVEHAGLGTNLYELSRLHTRPIPGAMSSVSVACCMASPPENHNFSILTVNSKEPARNYRNNEK